MTLQIFVFVTLMAFVLVVWVGMLALNGSRKESHWGEKYIWPAAWFAIGLLAVFRIGMEVPATRGVCLMGSDLQPYQTVTDRLTRSPLSAIKVVLQHNDDFYAAAVPEQNAVHLSTGLLEQLSPEGVMAVLAHEMAHLYLHAYNTPRPRDAPSLDSPQKEADVYGAQLLHQEQWSSLGFQEVIRVGQQQKHSWLAYLPESIQTLLWKSLPYHKRPDPEGRLKTLEGRLRSGRIPISPKEQQHVRKQCKNHDAFLSSLNPL